MKLQSFTKINKDNPIGIFDSGVGGMSVAVELSNTMPNENLFYVGDTKFFPYGTKSVAEVQNRVIKIGKWLQKQGCKLIIIACNTASAAGLEVAQKVLDVPVVGVVKPGARTAARSTRNNKIGVLATKTCVDSKAYSNEIILLNNNIWVQEVAAPELVEIVENELPACVLHHEDSYEKLFPINLKKTLSRVSSKYCELFINKECDTIVLGCTHFPFVGPAIQKVVGQDVKLVSPSMECVKDCYAILHNLNMLNQSKDASPAKRFYATGVMKKQYAQFCTKVFEDAEIKFEELDI